jgi:hypothetical protein
MLDARNDHPHADLFLGVYAELLMRGAWTPTLEDESKPAGVWINFVEFESVARRNHLTMPPSIELIRALQVKPKVNRPDRYPRLLHWRGVDGRPRAREYYVELHDLANPWGLYPSTSACHDARFGSSPPVPRPGEAPGDLVIAVKR